MIGKVQEWLITDRRRMTVGSSSPSGIKRVGDKSFELECENKSLSISYDQVKSALVKVSFK